MKHSGDIALILFHRSVSPALLGQGYSRGLGGGKALGPGDSGVSNASFETAREEALSRMSSGQDAQLQLMANQQGRLNGT